MKLVLWGFSQLVGPRAGEPARALKVALAEAVNALRLLDLLGP